MVQDRLSMVLVLPLLTCFLTREGNERYVAMWDLWPICLLGRVPKLLAKVLTLIFKDVLPKVVSDCQDASVVNWKIVYNTFEDRIVNLMYNPFKEYMIHS